MNNEITALLHLIDDPDEEVFDAVSQKIVDYGKPIIPNLEHLWETTPDEGTQIRIELLIHRLHYRDLSEDFRQWSISGHHDLMLGALLVCKFQYPELSTTPVLTGDRKSAAQYLAGIKQLSHSAGAGQHRYEHPLQLLWVERRRNKL